MGEPLKEAKSVRKLVESFQERRLDDEKRLSPRFMTADALVNSVGVGRPSGILICRKEVDQSQYNEQLIAKHRRDTDKTGMSIVAFEKLCDMHIIDFSEEGLQIYFKYNNQTKILSNTLLLQIGITRISVYPIWYHLSQNGNRSGFEFANSIESDGTLASLIIKLSDRFIEILINDYLPNKSADYDQACVYAYLSIFYNLRLRFLQALAFFNEAKQCIEQFVDPLLHKEMLHIFFEFDGLRSLHLRQARALGADRDPPATLAPFIKPFRDFECGISGKYQKVCFLERDALNVLENSIIFWNWSIQPPDELIDQVMPPYNWFMALKTLVPGVFESREFVNQFNYYSFLIQSITQLKDRLIDLVSAPLPGVDPGNAGGKVFGAWEPDTPEPAPVLGTIIRLSEKGQSREIGTPVLEQKLAEAHGQGLGTEPGSTEEDFKERGLPESHREGPQPPEVRPDPHRFKKYIGFLLLAAFALAALSILGLPKERLPWNKQDRSPGDPVHQEGPANSSPGAVLPPDTGGDVAANAESSRLPTGPSSDEVPGKVSELSGSGPPGVEHDPGRNEGDESEVETDKAATDGLPGEGFAGATAASAAVAEHLEQATPAAPTPKYSGHRFGIEAGQMCWIQVKIDNGKTRSVMMKPGDRLEWEVGDRVDIVIGNSGGVRVTWDGQALHQLGRIGEPVKLNFTASELMSKFKVD